MDIKEISRGVTIILLASIILAISTSYKNDALLIATFLSFLVIISVNILAKKGLGYYFETEVKHKFWSWYQYGFRSDRHFKTPLPMAWLPLVLSLISRGALWWLAILEFDVVAKAERASRRHGLYRFTQVTEWHMALIAFAGILANIVFAVLGYLTGFELFAKLSIYYAIWSVIPLSSLDGSKIFFGNRYLWASIAIIMLLIFGWGLAI